MSGYVKVPRDLLREATRAVLDLAWEKGYNSVQDGDKEIAERLDKLAKSLNPLLMQNDTWQDKENMAIGVEINRACEELPEGWSIQIELEKDAGVITLYDPLGAPQNTDDGETFGESLDNAIELAVALDVEYRLEGARND